MPSTYVGRRNKDGDNDDVNAVDVGTDSETALRDAFVMFDEDKKGKLSEE